MSAAASWAEGDRDRFVSGLIDEVIGRRGQGPAADLGNDDPDANSKARDWDERRNGPKGVVLEMAAVRYVEHLRIRNLRPWTIYNREQALRRLTAWAARPILRLGETDLLRWQAQRAAEIQPEPRRTELSNVRQFYRWALAERLIKIDPTARIPMPRVARGLPRPIRDERLAGAMANADREMAAILGLAAFAGLRAYEIAGLDWSEVGLTDLSPHIRVVDGKGGHGRLVPVSDALSEILGSLPHCRGPVIRRLDGKAGRNRSHRISQRANEYLHEVGIDESLHQLRHRFASTAYQSCRDIRAVQDLLGHASPTTTSRYAAVASDVAIAAVKAAGSLRGPGGANG